MAPAPGLVETTSPLPTCSSTAVVVVPTRQADLAELVEPAGAGADPATLGTVTVRLPADTVRVTVVPCLAVGAGRRGLGEHRALAAGR